MRRILGFAVSVLGSVAVSAQAPPPQVLPVPIPGGDIVPPSTFINLFSPGDAALGLDGRDAEPHGITNFKGVTAMGYTMGQATDSAGNAFQVVTDLRVFQGDYIGAVSTSGVSASARAHGTFVLI